MKRLLFILIPLLFLVFSSCSNLTQDYYVTISVECDDNTELISLPGANSYLKTKIDTIIYCPYKLIPETDKNIDIVDVKSSDKNIIEIVSIDYNSKKIIAKTKAAGRANIIIYTKSYKSSTTLDIEVK